MGKITVRPARPEDAAELAPRVREADRMEIWLHSRRDPLSALQVSLEHSPLAWAGFDGDRLEVLWGAGPASLLSDDGRVWMIAGHGIERRAPGFLRRSVRFVAAMHELYPVLTNEVWAGNTAAIRWLKWLGFTFRDPVPLGPYGAPFIPFRSEVTHV